MTLYLLKITCVENWNFALTVLKQKSSVSVQNGKALSSGEHQCAQQMSLAIYPLNLGNFCVDTGLIMVLGEGSDGHQKH